MAYWLFKADPCEWSWQRQKLKGRCAEEWSGVRNYQARNNMRLMEKGEKGFFYHSQREKAIVGLVEIVTKAHLDSTSQDLVWECVDVVALYDLPQIVSLKQIKLNKNLKAMELVTNSRLSVQKVKNNEWVEICLMAGWDLDFIKSL